MFAEDVAPRKPYHDNPRTYVQLFYCQNYIEKKSEEKLNNRVKGGELGLLAKNVFRLRYFLFRVYFFHCLGSTL